VTAPFIVENGGAIFIPKGYFPFPLPCSKKTRKYAVLELGIPYSVVREKLGRASTATGVAIVGFGDMSADEVANETGLSLPLAKSAKEREYDEPFRLVHGNQNAMEKAIATEGLTLVVGGKYFHVLGNSDKGKAVAILKELFARKFRYMITYGVGDSENDLSMLAAVDKPILVRRESGGRNANLVAWRNVLSLVAETSSEQQG
jgi:mannosyl-3-phosphoglycerate phosphatase